MSEGSKRAARSSPASSCIRPRSRPGSSTRGVPVRRLARGRGPVVVAGPAARAARRVRLAVQRAVGLRGLAELLAEPDARVTAGEIEDFVARHPYWIGDWARFAGAEAIADQVRFEREWGRCAPTRAERGVRLIGDVPIYVSDGGADVDGSPELFAHGEVAGAPPDALSANGQHWGNPLYDWPAHRATGYRWWIERFRRVRARRPVAHRPLPRLRRVLGGPGAAQDGASADAGGGPRRRALPRGRARARRPPGDRGGPGRDHAGRLRAARRARPARHGRPPLGVRGAREPARLANHRAQPVVYTSTHDTDTTAVVAALRRAARATGLDPHEPHWGLIELASHRARCSRSCRRRTCSASAARHG